MRQLVERIAEAWCRNMHDGVMWPYRGHYQCRKCFREYPVEFEVLAGQPRTHRHDPVIGVAAVKAA
jgi:hypothetical protein